MEKVYQVRIAFGDGRPLNTEVKAKSGAAAWDLIKKEHPSARSMHILGLADLVTEHPLFG